MCRASMGSEHSASKRDLDPVPDGWIDTYVLSFVSPLSPENGFTRRDNEYVELLASILSLEVHRRRQAERYGDMIGDALVTPARMSIDAEGRDRVGAVQRRA